MWYCYGMKIDTDPKKIQTILERGVEDIFIKEELEKKLKSGRQLIIKLGFDPTGPKIHIGRAVVLRKLKAFQELGHQVVFIVGDFTAQVGDPSDKLEKRPMLSKEDIEKNIKDYKKLVGKIIDVKKAKFVYNSKWLSKLGFQEISQLAESFTVQQMSSRRNFKDRLEKGEEVSLREFLYPLMQGYDSVMVKADVELGGFDQLFNLKAGRIIQKYYHQPEQDVLTVQMLEGLDGRKMSTSWGNVVNIDDEPEEMFGKIMSLKDELIVKYFTLCTDLDEERIKEIEKELKEGKNPRDVKMDLAYEVVCLYHSNEEADKAKTYFVSAFQKREVPEEVREIKAGKGEFLSEVLLRSGLVKSKSDFRRLVEEGAISEEGERKINDPYYRLEKEEVFKVGKKNFVKIKV